MPNIETQDVDIILFIKQFFIERIDQTAALLERQDTHIQIGIASAILLIGVMTSWFLNKRYTPFKNNDEGFLRTTLTKALDLSAPLISIVLAKLVTVTWSLLGGSVDVLTFVLGMFVIWLLWSAIQSFVGSPLIRSIATWVLLPAAILLQFNELTAVTVALESIGFTLGKVEITAYTIVKALVFFSVIFSMGRFLSETGTNYIRGKENLNISTKELLVKLFDICLYIILFIITIDLIGIDLTALTVFGGALGVGLGFGLQKIASNFISGIILLSERSITLGNLVEMDNGIFGHMRRLGARASIIETLDGQEVMVPNEDFITSRVSNYTHTSNMGRITIPVGVSYDADLKEAQKLILSAAKNYDGVSRSPDHKPECLLREFGDSSVDFLLIFWMDDVLKGRWRVQSDVMFAVWDNLKEGGIEIPFPQRSLHLKSGQENLTPPDKDRQAGESDQGHVPSTEQENDAKSEASNSKAEKDIAA